jgi:act minimal PKS acyl carrier protein
MPAAPFTLDDLKEILVVQTGFPESDLPEDVDTPFALLGLDSLAVVQLQIGLEQDCGFEIPDEDAHHITSPRAVLDYVNERLGLTRS